MNDNFTLIQPKQESQKPQQQRQFVRTHGYGYLHQSEPRSSGFFPTPRKKTQPRQLTMQRTNAGEYQPLFVEEVTFGKRLYGWVTYAIGWKLLALVAMVVAALLAANTLRTQTFVNESANQLDERGRAVISLEAQVDTLAGDNQSLQEEIAASQIQTLELQNGNQSLEERITELLEEINTIKLDAEAEIGTSQEEFEELQLANEALAEELLAQKEQFATFAKINRLLTTTPTEIGPEEARGTLYLTEEQNNFVLAGLEPLSDEEIYQVWVAREAGTMISAGLFSTISADTALFFQLDPPIPAEEIIFVGISIEPTGGSDSPSGTLLLTSS